MKIVRNNPSSYVAERNSVPIRKTVWLFHFREVISVYSENNTKHINTFCGQNLGLHNVKSRDTLYNGLPCNLVAFLTCFQKSRHHSLGLAFLKLLQASQVLPQK
jgi:hypothetical protein